MSIDLSKVLKKREQLKTNKNTDVNPVLWKPTENHTVRILPLQSDPSYPFQELYFYYGFAGQNILSPISYGETDPILEFGNSLISNGGGKLSKEEYKAIKKRFSPQKRTFVPILVRTEEKMGCRFWGFGKTIYEQLLATIEEVGDITDVLTGQDIKLTFKTKEQAGKDFPETTMVVIPKQSPVTTDEVLLEMLLHKQPVLLEQFDGMRKSAEELNKLLDKVVELEPGEPTESTPTTSDTWADEPPAEEPVTTSDEVAAEFKELFNKS